MECPRDQSELAYEGFWKHPRYACPACRGTLVLERDMVDGLGHKEARGLDALAEVKIANLGDSELRCPKDGTLLKALSFGDSEIDVCAECRCLWLDHGEYEKIVSRMKARAETRRPNPKLAPPPEVEESAVNMEGVLDVIERGLRSFWAGVRIARRL